MSYVDLQAYTSSSMEPSELHDSYGVHVVYVITDLETNIRLGQHWLKQDLDYLGLAFVFKGMAYPRQSNIVL